MRLSLSKADIAAIRLCGTPVSLALEFDRERN